MLENENKKSIFEKNWFIISSIILFFPLGLYLLWKYSTYSKKVKIYITISIIGLLIISNFSNNKNLNDKSISNVNSAEVNQSKISKNIQKQMNINIESANLVEEILKKCGITELNSVSHKKDEDTENEKMYELSVNDGERAFLYTDGSNKVIAVRYSAENLYKNGEYLAKIDDFLLKSDERDKYQFKCENVIKGILKAPKTAEFAGYGDWNFIKDKDGIKVSSFVDSENSFGAMLRTKFKIEFNRDGNIKKAIIGDQVYNF